MEKKVDKQMVRLITMMKDEEGLAKEDFIKHV